MKKNYFIAFEGLDGSGKSTQVKLLSDKLKKEGHKVYTTFEPTDSFIGKIVRDIFKHKIEADHKTIAALFLADRLNHLQNKTNGILKQMEEGYTVISDRYYFSSYAYHGTHVDIDWVIQANSLCADLLRPDLNIFVDVPPDICMQRLNTGRNTIELYEDLENLHSVKGKYFEAFDKLEHVESIFVTNGNRSPEIIFDDIWNKVDTLLKPHKSYT
jgi:dTMP kinase